MTCFEWVCVGFAAWFLAGLVFLFGMYCGRLAESSRRAEALDQRADRVHQVFISGSKRLVWVSPDGVTWTANPSENGGDSE